MIDICTPCYIYDREILKKNIEDLRREFEAFFSSVIIGYSFKTNNLPVVLSDVKKCGCFAEVVSDFEYELAERIGFHKDNIVFNGPLKSEALFNKALSQGSIINIDSANELKYIQNLETAGDRGIGIRVNIDLETYLPGHTITGDEGGRFGFSYENGELHRAIEICRNKNIDIDGLHMHVSSRTKSTEVYRVLAETAVRIANEEHLDLKYIDIGGGFFGGNDGGKAYREYAETLNDALASYKNIKIIIEPGASLIATAFSYVVTVRDIKQTKRAVFVTTDGSRLHIDPFLRRNKHDHSFSMKDETERKLTKEKQIICGYTCMENDRIMSIENGKELSCGDRLTFNTVGSYSLSFNSMFIRLMPKVYMKDGEKYDLVRDELTVDDYLRKNIW